MTTRDDIERHLYRAITGNRLGPSTHTVPNALKALGSRFKQPWKVAGVSRETWRRWNLPQGARNAQKPSPSHQAGLLAALRRMRLADSREARMRQSTGITIRAWDNYEDIERVLGKTSLGWTGPETRGFIHDILNAFLLRGAPAAVDAWLAGMPASAGWAQEWLHPDSHGSSQSMDLLEVSFMGDPSRAGRSSGSTRRR